VTTASPSQFTPRTRCFQGLGHKRSGSVVLTVEDAGIGRPAAVQRKQIGERTPESCGRRG
jgi:hypothetical protein